MATVIQIGDDVTIQPDAATLRERSVSAELTRWPVEDGATIADHSIVQNRRWSCEMVWTEQPLVDVAGPAPGELRPDQAFALLEAACIGRTRCQVRAPGTLLEDLVLVSVSSPRTLADGYSRRIRIEAEQVQVVTAQEESIANYLAVAARLRAAAAKRSLAAAQAKATEAYDGIVNDFAKNAIITALNQGSDADGIPEAKAVIAVNRLLGIEVQ